MKTKAAIESEVGRLSLTAFSYFRSDVIPNFKFPITAKKFGHGESEKNPNSQLSDCSIVTGLLFLFIIFVGKDGNFWENVVISKKI